MSKFFIGAVIDGFPVICMIEGETGSAVDQVIKLDKYGAKPLPLPFFNAAARTPRPTTSAAPVPQTNAPMCRYHGPMRASIKEPGTWFCPKKLHDGSHCPEAA